MRPRFDKHKIERETKRAVLERARFLSMKWSWRPKNNCMGVIPLLAMTERRAAESRSLWSIIEVDKITAGLVLE